MSKIRAILMIDDDEATNFFNKYILNQMEVAEVIHCAKNGKEALELLDDLESKGERTPELILLDINMPVMDGFEFLDNYEKKYGTNTGSRVMMLTTSLIDREIEQSRKFKEVHGFLFKPLDQGKIRTIVSELVNNTES